MIINSLEVVAFEADNIEEQEREEAILRKIVFNQMNEKGAQLHNLLRVVSNVYRVCNQMYEEDFPVFKSAELVVGIAAPGCANYTRKEIDALIDWVKRPQVGASGMVYVKCEEDGTFKSSVDKFYDQEDLKKWAEITNAKPGDLILILSGNANKVRTQLSALRMEVATRLGLRKSDEFAPLWVVDFPLLEWDEESGRYHAMHHPFTSPKPEDMALIETEPGKVRANAYDMVLNGNEIGGGSIRIHDRELQSRVFDLLGFSKEEALAQFGFLMNAFEFGAPPHGGLAFGLDRLVSILGGQDRVS